MKLVDILKEIKIKPDYDKEWRKIWYNVMIKHGWDPNTADEDEEFNDHEDEINRETDRIFEEKFGIEYRDTLDEIQIDKGDVLS